MTTNLKRLLLMCGITAAGIVAVQPLGDVALRSARDGQIAWLVGALVVSLCAGVIVFVKR